MIPTPILRTAAVVLFATVILFSFLGGRGLNEPDEGRYAEIGREMAASNNWLVPHLNGFEHFQKPPLLYWATGASIKVFGANEWAARIPSALAAIGTIVLTLLIARMLWGDARTESFAALILSTTVGFFALARLLTPDMTLTFWITAAATCFVASRHNGRIWAWLFFVAMGFGFMTKGPMAFVVPLSAVAGWHWARRRENSPEKKLPWVRGICLALGIGLSWFIAVTLIYPETAGYFLRYELLERFGSHAHGRAKPFWFFVPVLVVGLMPWTFFLPRLLRAAVRTCRAPRQTPVQLFLLGWVLPPLCVLSLSGSKLATYVLPLFPAIALGLARILARDRVTAVPVPRIAFASAAFLLGVDVALAHWNDALQQQASVRHLASRIQERRLENCPQVFACGVRAHGLEFYLRRVVTASEAQSDIVLSPNAAQQQRLLPAPAKCEATLLERASANRGTAIGLVRRQEFERNFHRERWDIVDRAGDFLLIQTRPSALAIALWKE